MGQVFLHVLRFSPLTIIPPNFHIPSLIFHKSYTSVGIESVFREHDLIHVNQDRYFVTKFNDETSPRFPIHSGVPHGSILGPLLYTLYTSDLPASRKTTLSTLRMIELYLRLIQILRQPPSISRTLYVASKNGSSYGK